MHQEYFAVIQNTNVQSFLSAAILICDLSTRNENVYSGILNDLQGTPCVSSVYFLSVERYNPYATNVNSVQIPLVHPCSSACFNTLMARSLVLPYVEHDACAVVAERERI